MSITVDYFFNFPVSLGELGEVVGGALGVRFEPQDRDGSDLFCRFLSMELSLSRHALENDRECTFEEFEFVLGSRTPAPDVALRAFQVETMIIVACVLHARAAIDGGLLVFDTQQVLARYVSRRDETDDDQRCLHDLVSGKDVRFPDHFVDVAARITRSGWRP